MNIWDQLPVGKEPERDGYLHILDVSDQEVFTICPHMHEGVCKDCLTVVFHKGAWFVNGASVEIQDDLSAWEKAPSND